MKNKIRTVLVSATCFGLMGACGGDKSDSDTSSSTGSTTGTVTGTVTGTGTGTPTSTGTGTSTTGAGGNTSTSTVTGTGTTSGATCTNTADEGLAASDAEIPASQGVYSYGDRVTTMCIETGGANNVCLAGLGADATPEYTNWGAGAGVQLATDEDGVVTPWNATAAGVVGVKFTISGVSTDAPVRVGVTMVDTDEVTLTDFPYTADADGLKAPGESSVMFADLMQPTWSDVEVPFDATQIHSLQFQVVTADGETRPYSFCVDGITWVDAAGNTVDLPWAEDGGGEGGAAGAGGAGQ